MTLDPKKVAADREAGRDCAWFSWIDPLEARRVNRLGSLEAFYLENHALPARVAELEAEIATLKTAIAEYGAEAVGIARSVDPDRGAFLWGKLRATLTPKEDGK
jgi:hypothetical protein